MRLWDPKSRKLPGYFIHSAKKHLVYTVRHEDDSQYRAEDEERGIAYGGSIPGS